MKPSKEARDKMAAVSPPTRGRGLKPANNNGRYTVLDVAPHAGAWIETVSDREFMFSLEVAPHAGAWIET